MHIGGKEATEIALEANQRRPIVLQASADASALIPMPAPQASADKAHGNRKPPVRVRKPTPGNDR